MQICVQLPKLYIIILFVIAVQNITMAFDSHKATEKKLIIMSGFLLRKNPGSKLKVQQRDSHVSLPKYFYLG